MTKGISFVALCFLVYFASAQEVEFFGSVVLHSGTVQNGKVSYPSNNNSGEAIHFISIEGEKYQYLAGDIKSYQLDNGKYFESKNLNGRDFFLELLIKGRLSVYCLDKGRECQFFLEKEGVGIIPLKYEKRIRLVNGRWVEYHTTTHIGVLKQITSDSPASVRKANSIEVPERGNLTQFAWEYHKEIAGSEELSIYYHDPRNSLVRSELLSVPGSVVLISGDTLKGTIHKRGDAVMGRRCVFQVTGGASKTFLPSDLISYQMDDGSYYVSRNVEQKQVFLQCLLKARISIYFIYDDTGKHFYVEKLNSGMLELVYGEEIDRIEGKLLKRESTSHKGILRYLASDVPEMHSAIDHMGKPRESQLIKFGVDYHRSFSPYEEYSLYKYQKPGLNGKWELLFGLKNLRNLDTNTSEFFLVEGSYFLLGVVSHIQIKRPNDRFYFRSGLLFTNIERSRNEGSVGALKIPLMLEHYFPSKSNIRPKLAGGLNIYLNHLLSAGLAGGAEIKLDDSNLLSFNVETDFTTNEVFPLVPDQSFTTSFGIGWVFH